MSRRFAALVAIIFVSGCIGYFVAKRPSYEAKGTWTGTLEPVQVVAPSDDSTGIVLRVRSGTELRNHYDNSQQMPNEGLLAVLTDEQGKPLTWSADRPREGATVTGRWMGSGRSEVAVVWEGKRKDFTTLVVTAPTLSDSPPLNKGTQFFSSAILAGGSSHSICSSAAARSIHIIKRTQFSSSVGLWAGSSIPAVASPSCRVALVADLQY